MPGMDDDWMFDITSSRDPATVRQEQLQPASPSIFHADASSLQPSTLHTQPIPAHASSAAAVMTAAAHNESVDPELLHLPEAAKQQQLTQPRVFDEVPASVREAVVRFESWTLAQSEPVQGAQAPVALQPHDQRQSENQQQHSLPPQQPEQRHWSQEQHQQQQHQQQQHYDHEVPQQQLHQQQRDVQQEQDHPVLQHQQKKPQHQQALRQETSSRHANDSQQSLECEAQAPHQPPSHALSLIDATLAAINDIHTSSATSALSAHTAPSANSACATALPSSSTISSSSLSGPSGLAAAGHRPPLPFKRPALTVAPRPGFADAFANPALYQQPWLCQATTSEAARTSAAGTSSLSHHYDTRAFLHSTAAANRLAPGLLAGHPTRSSGAQALNSDIEQLSIRQALPASSGASSSGTGDVPASTICLSHNDNAANSHVAPSSNASSMSKGYGDTAGRPATGGDAPRRAGLLGSTRDTSSQAQDCDSGHLSLRRVFTDSSGVSSSGRGDTSYAPNGSSGGSRWSAVNAYRQAREAAEKATQGTNCTFGVVMTGKSVGSLVSISVYLHSNMQ